MNNFGIRREVDGAFEEVLAKVPEALKTEGFGILTEIDVQETLKKKLEVDFRRYKILGACNPPLAYRALSAELEIGLMLPCNVIVYEKDGGGVVVTAIDPMRTVASIDNPELKSVATEVKKKLERVIERL